jgi:outer membrane protein OmpA-like peptidoglycan-associated protein
VRELELSPLSPYAIKYAGYGIERGKLSVDLAYVVQPDGQLSASNRIVLNQLAFGEKVEGSTANLPVKLAVALLADKNGVIDIDLPVSGSLNDPQFSLAGIVFKLIGNLIVKAVTAPFALLASSAGGSGESSTIEFAPGSATLTPEARQGLDKVAQALLDRPALTLTISGESRLESEREGWKRERLRQALRSEKRRQAIAGGASPGAEVTFADAAVPALLKEVYRRADIVKPKNALGIPQDLPPTEMESLLLASIVVDEDAMQQLAVRRGVVVRDYLTTRELPSSRLFLGAPKVAAGDTADWTPRVDLKLTLG